MPVICHITPETSVSILFNYVAVNEYCTPK